MRAGSKAGADLPPHLVRSTSRCQEVLKGRLEQPPLVGGVSAHGRGSGMRWVLKSFPTQIILWCSFVINTRQNQPAQDFCRKQGVKQNSPAKPFCVLGRKVQMDSSRLEKPRPSYPFIPEGFHLRLLFCVSRQDRTNKLAPRC